ncbi:MAG: TlpA disulfide reductase family protein [Usitatibacter sp.]
MNPHTAILRIVAMAVALAANAGTATELKTLPGKPAPALEREDLNGARVDVARLRGQVVLVNFWATWCEPCIAEMPSIERLRVKLEGRPFTVLTVNYGEGAEKVAAFMKKNRLSLPVLLDPAKESARAWGAGGLPMTFLVDGRGNLRFSAFGESDWSQGEPLRIVESLVAEARRAR